MLKSIFQEFFEKKLKRGEKEERKEIKLHQ